jgi:capsular polysaccharide biosynthesis protein
LIALILMPRKYVSTEQLMVSIDGSSTAAAYQNDEVVGSRINSYIPLLTSDVVSQRVIDKLGLPLTAPELAAKISATRVPPNTALIDVAVIDESPSQARLIAAMLAEEFISYTEALETPTGEDGQRIHTTIVTPAREPDPQITKRVLLGVLVAAAALLAGAVAVWIRARTDPVTWTADDAAHTAGLPVLGSVVTTPKTGAPELQEYRRLLTRLPKVSNNGSRGRLLLLASANGEADVAAVALNFGRVLELTGDRTVVLDAATPEHNEDESNREAPEGDQHLWPVPDHGDDGHPDTLSASAWTDRPDLFAEKTGVELIDRLKVAYRNVVIAVPAVLSAITASLVSNQTDDVLLLASLGATRRRDLRSAADELRSADAPLAGLVLVSKGTEDEPTEPAGVEADETPPSSAPSEAVVSPDEMKGT